MQVDTTPAEEPSTDDGTSEEVIYADDPAVNAFILRFNAANPDLAITGDAITKYYHHGREHDDQVQATVNGTVLTISSEGYKGSRGASVFFDNPAGGTAEANRELFGIIVRSFDPSLGEGDFDALWAQVVEGNSIIDLPGGIEVQVSPTMSDATPGSYAYMKIQGPVS